MCGRREARKLQKHWRGGCGTEFLGYDPNGGGAAPKKKPRDENFKSPVWKGGGKTEDGGQSMMLKNNDIRGGPRTLNQNTGRLKTLGGGSRGWAPFFGSTATEKACTDGI